MFFIFLISLHLASKFNVSVTKMLHLLGTSASPKPPSGASPLEPTGGLPFPRSQQKRCDAPACDCVESVCEGMKEELWTDGDTCYVPYPQPGSDERRTWYEARNKCLHLNGDLATNGITSVVLRRLETDEEYRTSSRNKRYWIGLQRDPLMKSLSGMRPFSNRPIKICYTTTFSCSSVP